MNDENEKNEKKLSQNPLGKGHSRQLEKAWEIEEAEREGRSLTPPAHLSTSNPDQMMTVKHGWTEEQSEDKVMVEEKGIEKKSESAGEHKSVLPDRLQPENDPDDISHQETEIAAEKRKAQNQKPRN